MKDDEIRAHFDGRGRVELLPGHAIASKQGRIGEIAHALGYRLLATQSLGRAGVRLVYERDDAPHARRRAEQTIERLRAGDPVLPAIEPPPPPPAPPLMSRQTPPRPRRSLEPQPPPPPTPPGPRIPSRPPHPPPPPPPPSVTPDSSPG